MKEIRSNKKQICHTALKFSEIIWLALIMQVNIVYGEPDENITFVTTGSSFSPIITVIGNPSIQWTFGDGSTSTSNSPNVNFGSARTRVNTLVVEPWSAVTKINIGYDGSDEGVTPSSSTIANLEQQNVISVSGLESVAPYLQVWASNRNPITALDFSNFTALQTIECFSCRSLSIITLRNVPSLTRLCVEQSNISFIDLSEAPALADFRGASQRSPTYTINWGNTGANLWHICVRDNPQMTSRFPFSQFPLLQEFFNWNDNQSGTLYLTSTNLREVLSANNHYNAAVLSGCFLAGRNGEVEIQNNDLTSLDISNDPGLFYLNASFNLLNQTAVDGILQMIDSFDTRGGYLDLNKNAAPSNVGIAHANNLTSRGWNVQISSRNNQPTANFTINVTSGTAPLEVQFNDTSANNPTTWLWDFGDGTYSTEESPKNTYTSPGNYLVTLGVRNADGADSKVDAIIVLKQPILPIANFSNSIGEGYVPLSVQFNDLSENTEERFWDFGDGTASVEQNPSHTYLFAGTYTVNLIVGNANGTTSKQTKITVQSQSSSSGDNSSSSSSSSSSGSSSGSSGGGAGSSPESQSNVEAKELSQAFISSGNRVNFDFPQKVTPVVNVSFSSKKTAGKTTTIVETLKDKSSLVLELPSGKVYKSFNIWVGNSGFATQNNIENSIVCFKVEKSWVQDEKIDQSSITLNRYSESAWSQLPTSLLNEDDKYLYFTAKTPGFSSFAITGKSTATGAVQPSADKTQLAANDTQAEYNTRNTTANPEQTPEKKPNANISKKENANMPAFEISFSIICLVCVFWHRRRKKE